MLPALLALFIQTILLAASGFTFSELWDKIVITSGKLPPGFPLGEPGRMLLKINTGPASAPKAFDVSSVTMNRTLPFQRTL